MNALRLEKGFGSWGTEYRPLYGPVETGLDRFVAYSKNADFIGRDAALAEREEGGEVRLRIFVIDAERTDVLGDEPIWRDDRICGRVTSGGFRPCLRKIGGAGLCTEISCQRDGRLGDRDS